MSAPRGLPAAASAEAGRPRRFLVTGGTGFLGAHLVRELLRRGHAVTALVRDGRDGSAQERFRRVLEWLGVGREDAARAAVVAGDVAEERFGLAEARWRALAAATDEVVHSAAATSFAASRAAALERVNVRGTEVALGLLDGGPGVFHLVSSAYAAGAAAGVVPEAAGEPAAFTNAYEETKHRAERLARAACARRGARLLIHRPAIVYGDSETGRSLRFNALYYPIRTLLALRDLGLEEARRGGTRARDCGVEPLAGGGARLPLRVESHPEASLDLVPVDHFARAFLALREGAREGGTFHIVSGDPVRLETLIGYIRRRYRIEGLAAVPAESFAARPRTALESLLQAYLGPYGPYLADRRRFSDAAARPHLEAAGLRCPRLDYEVFDRALGYAEEVAWGKALFPAARGTAGSGAA